MAKTPKRPCPKQSYKKSFGKPWRKTSSPKRKIFVTHDNGARPFTVKIAKDFVNVEWKKKSKRFETTRVFVGKSFKNGMTEFSCGYGKQFDGNSILLKVPGNHKYVYIGESVKSFDALDEIKAYYSPVGNSNVPYPFAVDKSKNVYLMIENVILTNYDFDKNNDKKNDPYRWYYDNSIIVDKSSTFRQTKTGKMVPIPKKQSNFQGITDYFVEEDGKKQEYTFRYDPFPEMEKHAFIVKHAKTLPLSLADSKKLFAEYGAEKGFTPLRMKILVSRDF